MLPDDVYLHYYDRPCEACNGTIVINGGEEVYNCEVCGKDFCETCLEDAQCSCHACEDREDTLGAPTTCPLCIIHCRECDLKFHTGLCQEDHRRTCNPLGRAQRRVDTANERVQDAQRGVNQAQQELLDAQQEQGSAQAELAQLQQQRR